MGFNKQSRGVIYGSKDFQRGRKGFCKASGKGFQENGTSTFEKTP